MYKYEPFLRNVNNLSDARFAASEGFQGMCFQMDPQKDGYISQDEINELTQWVSGPLVLGSFTTDNTTLINDAIDRLSLDGAEMFSRIRSEQLKEIKGLKLLRVDLEEAINISPGHLDLVDYLVLSTSASKLRQEGNTMLIETVCRQKDLILEIGFLEEKHLDLLEAVEPAGIFIQGGDEIETGIRSYDQLYHQLELLNY